jgi:hypothetical protein
MSRQTNAQNSNDAGQVSAAEPNGAPIPITTDSSGIETGDTHVPTGSGDLPIYFALPDLFFRHEKPRVGDVPGVFSQISIERSILR